MSQSFSCSDWRELTDVSKGYDDEDAYPVDDDIEPDIDVERLRGD